MSHICICCHTETERGNRDFCISAGHIILTSTPSGRMERSRSHDLLTRSSALNRLSNRLPPPPPPHLFFVVCTSISFVKQLLRDSCTTFTSCNLRQYKRAINLRIHNVLLTLCLEVRIFSIF